MAQPELVKPQELPEYVVVTQRTGARFTPNEIRALKAETGKTMQALMSDDSDDGDKMQTLAWLGLRRLGFVVPWEQCGDVTIEFQAEEPDPTSGEPSKSSPDSVDSGG